MTTSDNLRKLSTAGVIAPIPSYVETLEGAAASHQRLRTALERMVAEFGDYHYENCPADFHETSSHHGPCDCPAGALLNDARAALAEEA